MNTRPSSPPADPPDLAAVEALIDDYIAGLDLPGQLADGVRYAVLGGGKRLRPTMVLFAARAVGGRDQDALVPAAAVEMFHAFTLVHDDLPAMDDDDLRRGRPTVHIAFGEALAILVGDCLMGLSTQIICERLEDPALAGTLVGELAAASTRVIAGQVHDTLGGLPDGLTPLEQLQRIHRNKTGALFLASCRLGALAGMWSGKVNPASLDAITRYGEATGLMFQVVDDLLDVEQSAEHIGKRTAKDEERGKLTYPGLLGIEASRAAVQRLHGEAMAALEPLGPAADGLRQLSEHFATRTR
ncbi:MAG: polyprenyl synthetase family protein [Phycisphaerales bacterium]|nr:polyprenyl synthetase family protein [Phycisphaerales bacterium]